MLVVTTRAKEKLRELAEEEVPETGVEETALGVRILLSGPDNGSRGSKCRIGVDQVRVGDEVEDMSGTKLLIDPSTLAYLRRISAILDLSHVGQGEDLVLIIERS